MRCGDGSEMKLKLPLCLAAGLLSSTAAHAQPADLPIPVATTSDYPPGVSVRQTRSGPVYADARGRTLYGMDLRTLLRWSPDPSQHCQADCAQQWEPMLAPAEAKVNIAFPRGFGGPPAQRAVGSPARPPGPPPLPPGFVAPQSAPDWTVISGPQGPQWVYKGWHMVFARKSDRPGWAAFEGAESKTWNTLKFVPPVPKLVAPANVTTLYANGAYQLANRDGRALFTGNCTAPCTGWAPLSAPMASHGLGEWSVSLAGDSPQWRWRGKPVYVSQDADLLAIPKAGKVLRP